MIDAVNLVLDFFTKILALIPDSPFMWLFALAVVLTVFNHIFFMFDRR